MALACEMAVASQRGVHIAVNDDDGTELKLNPGIHERDFARRAWQLRAGSVEYII